MEMPIERSDIVLEGALGIENKYINWFTAQPTSNLDPTEPHLRIVNCFNPTTTGIHFLVDNLPAIVEAKLVALYNSVYSK